MTTTALIPRSPSMGNESAAPGPSFSPFDLQEACQSRLEPHAPPIVVARDDQFVLIDLALGPVRGRAAARDELFGEAFLRCNGTLGAGAKFALKTSTEMALRVEICLAGDMTVSEQDAREVLDALRRGLVWFQGREHEPLPRPLDCPLRSHDQDATELLKQSCISAGWQPRAREDGLLVVPLDVPGVIQQAVLTAHDRSWARACVELRQLDAVSASSRQALAVFLLLLNGTARPARAAIVEHGSQETLVLEAFARDFKCASEIDTLLAGLSVAARLSHVALEALSDEWIARDYLRLRDRGFA